MGKSPSCEKNGLKKGPWTAEEDQKLIDYIQKHGHGRWRTLPKNAGLKRCGKSCRLRWTNYLRPDIKRGKFSVEEEEAIIQLHGLLGNKWSAIASRLPGRTDNEIKNYWNTHVKKKLLRMGIDPVSHKPRLDLLHLYSFLSSSLYNNNSSQINLSCLLGIGSMLNPTLLNLAASLLPSQPNNQEISAKNVQDNPFHNLQQNEVQENQFHHSAQFLNQTQFMQTNFNGQSLLQSANYMSGQDLIQNCGYHAPMMNNSCENLSSFGFSSLMSALSSSTTPLQSSSTTYVNGSTEDERDSYCSNMLMFDIPNGLDVNGLL